MARSKTQLERNTFVRGLITEASPLTFPENASIDERNFILNRDGSRRRRLGVDIESTGVQIDTEETPLTFDEFNISTFKWDGVENDPTKSYGVVQIGHTIYIVNLFSSTLSTDLIATIDINNSDIATISGNARFDYAAVDGKLIIVSAELEAPLLLTADGDEFTIERVDLEVRDIWGVDDGLQIDERPTTTTQLHEYNLLNQGWNQQVLADFREDEEKDPSNADVVWFGKKSDGKFDSELITASFFGNAPAAKGKFIISAFDRGSTRISGSTAAVSQVFEADRSHPRLPAPEPASGEFAGSGLTDLPIDKEEGRVQTAASFAGRIFYSGINSSILEGDNKSPSYSGTILFTQVITNALDFRRCYQQNDPTAEDFFDLLDTDGGTIKIPEANAILKLQVLGNSLLVIADNGVWSITGPDNVFKATEYSVNKVTNVGCISKGSVVEAEGSVLYWANGGIYGISSTELGVASATNITETTIQTVYNNINTVAKANSVGNFDPVTRKVSWLYNDSDDYDGVNLRKKYNKELILDTVLTAFYINEFGEAPTDSPFIAGYMPTEDFSLTTVQQNVVVDGEQVQVNGEDVVVTSELRGRGVSVTKYLTATPNVSGSNYGISFAEYNNTDFEDWGEVDAPAYLITGYELFADTQRKKQATYLTTHFNRTETGFTLNESGDLEALGASSCKIQAQWDFANSANSGKWGSQFEAYRLRRLYTPTSINDPFDYGWEVISSKSKLRGSGRALSLRFDSSPGKDLYLLGWGMDIEGNTNV